MSDARPVWVVRGGDNNELASQIKSKNAVAIGWAAVDASKATTRDEVRHLFEAVAPAQATPNSIGQVFRFVNQVTLGDLILTPEKVNSSIHISRCAGACRFDPSVFGEYYPHVRTVEYLLAVPRSHFSPAVRNTLGSTLTVFQG